jgi:intracellular multiplication protein IcmG
MPPATQETSLSQDDQALLGGSDTDVMPSSQAAMAPAAPVQGRLDDVAALRLPSAQDVMLKTPVAEGAPTPAADLSAPPLAAQPVTPVTREVDVSAIEETLKGVITRLDATEASIRTLQDTIPPATVASLDDASRAEIASLKSGLESLQKSVAEMRRDRASAPAVAAPAPAARPQILGPAEDSPSVAPRAAAPATDSPRWVLRGAQPGQALVARAGQADTQTIRPGDTLPGIGRITAISYQDGRWVVEGTQGRITQ